MRIFARLLMMTIATLVAAAASSGYAGISPTFNLTLTENSSTSLSLSYNGPSGAQAFTVMNTAPDQWTVTTAANSNITFNFFDDFWEEPEDTVNKANEVLQPVAINGHTLFVYSDVLFDSLPNNTAAPTPIGSDGQAGLISLTFNDLGDAAAPTSGVPDSGSTLVLLALSGVALSALIRFRRPEVA
jgi:hypothetical protein